VCEDFDRAFALPNALQDRSVLNPGSAANESPAVDVLLCPTAPALPPTLAAVAAQSPLDSYRGDVLTVPASLAGLPALSVSAPARLQDWGEASRVGIQVIGQFGDEDMVLKVGEVIEDLEGGK
jgi:aspartyl-tRNA(Asn)/glutamyl-tRNA(Gln) amidotransferase subunit A